MVELVVDVRCKQTATTCIEYVSIIWKFDGIVALSVRCCRLRAMGRTHHLISIISNVDCVHSMHQSTQPIRMQYLKYFHHWEARTGN